MATTASEDPQQPTQQSAAAPSVGIIIPPPEIRNIVDKTAAFVAKNGWAFADRIRKEKEGEVKFNFLRPDNPYHAYFVHMVEEVKAGRAADSLANLNIAEEEEEEESTEDVLKEPKPFDFGDEPPPMSVQMLDILKLTALHVAKNGQQFLQELMQRESRNYHFDFLKPNHALYNYFTKLTEQYRKVLMPKREMLEDLSSYASGFRAPVKRMEHVAAWKRKEQQEIQRRADEEEAERIARAQIDWHDFVVVATVEFGPEDTDLPPPVQPEELGVRVIEMEQAEQQLKEKLEKQPKAREAPVEEREREEETAKEEEVKVEAKAKAEEAPEQQQGAMETEEDQATAATTTTTGEEAEAEKTGAAAAAAAAAATEAEEVKIREYNPKSKAAQQAAAKEEMLVSPLTGELIPASKMQEHMRISLLDPKWREEKERQEREARRRQEDWQRSSEQTMDYLKDIAARRTDIFGSGDVETEIGAKIGAEGQEESGVAQAAPTTTAATDASKTSVPPAPSASGRGARPPHAPPSSQAAPATAPPPQRRPPPPPSAASSGSAPGAGGPPSRPPPPPRYGMRAPPPGRPGFPPRGPGFRPPYGHRPPYGRPPMHRPPPPPPHHHPHFRPPHHPHRPGAPPPPPHHRPPVPGQGQVPPGPPPKRSKTEEMVSSLKPEDEFLKDHQGDVTVTAEVTVDDASFGLTAGTTVHVTLPYTAKVSELKSKLQGSLNLPANKQKVMINGVALANSKTLAFYNITAESKVEVGLKTRGGKK